MSIAFYLGTPEVSWLGTAGVPLCIAHQRLARNGRRRWPEAIAPWMLDSGAFSMLRIYGEWTISPEQYVDAVRRYDETIGQLDWAATQDWMCEPEIIDGGWHHGVYYAGTHLSVAEHQRRSVNNFLRLCDLWNDVDTCPFMPPIQGYHRDDYLRCLDLHDAAGVDLTKYPVVGLGSVCRRESTDEIGDVIKAIRSVDPQLPVHGFGVKQRGLLIYGDELTSADSTAWSDRARWAGRRVCGVEHRAQKCSNCLHWALQWRRTMLDRIIGAGVGAWGVWPRDRELTTAITV